MQGENGGNLKQTVGGVIESYYRLTFLAPFEADVK
jgi:hypothetical protein